MYIVVLIPARLESSRLPRKLLLPINGFSVIHHTLHLGLKSKANKSLVVTDSEDIYDECHPHAVFHRQNAYSGTHRLSNYVKEFNPYLKWDLIINLQGDEPLFELENLNKFIDFAASHPNDICTCIRNSNEGVQVKVVDGWGVSFSREERTGKGHLGLYSYPAKFLQNFQQNYVLDLEQSSFMPIRILELESESIGIDTPETLEKARKAIE